MEVRYQFGYPINRRVMAIADALNSPIALETQHEEYRGKYRPLQIIEVPIELPIYRIENIRTKSLQKQWLVTHPDCDKKFFSNNVANRWQTKRAFLIHLKREGYSKRKRSLLLMRAL